MTKEGRDSDTRKVFKQKWTMNRGRPSLGNRIASQPREKDNSLSLPQRRRIWASSALQKTPFPFDSSQNTRAKPTNDETRTAR